MDKRKKRRIGNLKKRWRRSYKEGKSEVNPDAVDFMEIKSIPENKLYRSIRNHLKYMIVINSDGTNISGLLLTTKKNSSKNNINNLKIRNCQIINKVNNPQYVELVIRNKDKKGNKLKNIDFKNCNIYLTISEKKIIKKNIDMQEKINKKKQRKINYYKNKKKK